MNASVEKIDSSKMTLLADFRFVDAPMHNIEHYYLGVLDDKFIVRIKDLAGNARGKVFFDRANYREVVARAEDVYAGKLKDVPDVDKFEFRRGTDFLIVGVNAVFPHTASAPIVTFYIQNNRRADFDNLESGGWDAAMSLETGKKMLSEMKRIETQVSDF